jgi:predicted ester cyclase
LKFNGHFTGEFAGHRGDGRASRFDAVDLYTIQDGRIVANWHLEDNLTLLKQLGVVGSQ